MGEFEWFLKEVYMEEYASLPIAERPTQEFRLH
jgi:hypothetical protein